MADSGQKLSQNDLWGSTYKGKKKKNRAVASSENTVTSSTFATMPELPRENRSHAGEPLSHALYVGRDLRSVIYTGRAGALPAGTIEHLWGGPEGDEKHAELVRLDRELYVRIKGRVEKALAGQGGAEFKATILERWRQVDDFAFIEGFDRDC